jgi:hypothetical protein
VSGESAPREAATREPLERVFGPSARCSGCGASVEHYRVVALFFHETAVVRAYCRVCYPSAVEGDYHARGDGLRLDYTTFAARFGPAGPPPPPVTPADRVLLSLVTDDALASLAPANEAFARKRGRAPYAIRAGFLIDGKSRAATFALAPDGGVERLSGDPDACARVRAATIV